MIIRLCYNPGTRNNYVFSGISDWYGIRIDRQFVFSDYDNMIKAKSFFQSDEKIHEKIEDHLFEISKERFAMFLLTYSGY